MKKLQDVGRYFVCEQCSMGTTSARQIAVPSKPETMNAAPSLFSSLFFQTESLANPSTSRSVDLTQAGRSSQQSTLFQKLYSIVTPTRPSRSISRAMAISAYSKAAARTSLLTQVSASTVDPGSGHSESLVKVNNEIEKDLDVEIEHSLFHGGSVECVKFSRDGKYLAAGCKDGKTYIYDVQQGTLTK
jgi:WD40 repeat protein